MRDRKRIALIGTLDTKGEELRFLKEAIEARGLQTLVIDIGLLGPPPFQPDISRQEVLREAGLELADLLRGGDEGEAIEGMTQGLALLLQRLHRQREIDGVLAIGGGQGSAMASRGLQGLPVGFPKLLVSTKVAQAGAGAYVGTRDILIAPSVADIAGLNRLTKRVLQNAAGAIVGMVQGGVIAEEEDHPLIAMSMLGTTTACGLRLKDRLEADGLEVVVFHALGVGGRAMEEFLQEEGAEVVVELAVNEIGNYLFGGLASAGPHRMEVAGSLGIPQVVTPGNADFINFLSPDTVPPRYRERRLHRHNPQATCMRLEAQEMELVGRTMAEKLNRARAPVKVIVPLKGFSIWDREGGVFYDPEANRALIEALLGNLREGIEVMEVELHINDPEFADLLYAEVKRTLELAPSHHKKTRGR